MENCIFYIRSNNTPISVYVTKKNEIMIEEADENSISADYVKSCVDAKGFNCCFDTPSKRNFAKSCKFNNIIVEKWQENENGNFYFCEAYTLAELRKSKSKLNKFIEG